MAKVLFVTDQWGYGTTTSAMSVAVELKESQTRWLIGDGAGHTLGRRSSFDECISADTTAASPPAALMEAVRESDVVVSVMNPNAAEVADQLGIPCVYVDTLLWMWNQPRPLPSSIARNFATGFRGVEKTAHLWQDSLPQTEVVAPLIAPSFPVDPRAQTNVLVNFGGLSSPLIPGDSLATYARTMVECVVRALADWPGEITISIGDHVLNRMDRALARLARSDVRFINLSHEEYLTALESCRLLISSPGLSATLEAFARGVPCLLLPSQNLSQALALQIMDREGAAFAMDWNVIYGLTGLTAQDENQSCQKITKCIERFQRDVSARARLVRHVACQLTPDRLECIAKAQTDFFDSYRGADGPKQVAAYVNHLVSPAASVYVPRGQLCKGTLKTLAIMLCATGLMVAGLRAPGTHVGVSHGGGSRPHVTVSPPAGFALQPSVSKTVLSPRRQVESHSARSHKAPPVGHHQRLSPGGDPSSRRG